MLLLNVTDVENANRFRFLDEQSYYEIRLPGYNVSQRTAHYTLD